MPDPSSPVLVRVPAKINISLSVGPLGDDGFHSVHTVYHAVDLCDVVSAWPADTLSLQLDGPEAAGLTADRSNLAWRAADLIAEHAGRRPDVALRLEKRIPIAAGLAGGSADAAGVLVALDRLWALGLSSTALDALAARLGSDVAFALHGGTAIGTGRGERLSPLPATALHWVLAVADGGLSTAAVYAELDAQRRDGVAGEPLSNSAAVLAAVRSADSVRLATELGNDLQPAAFALNPGLRTTVGAGVEAGALAGLVSGSGPTVAFLASGAEHAKSLAARLSDSPCCRYAIAVLGGVAGANVVSSPLPDSGPLPASAPLSESAR